MKKLLSRLFGPLAILATVFGAGPGVVRAQCSPQWLPGDAPPGVDNAVYAITTWDPDGPGPRVPLLVVGGAMVTAGGIPANHIAAWDGRTWSTFGSGLTGALSARVAALTTFDPDGDGPQLPLLIAGGEFSAAGGTPVSNIAAWNGMAWSPLGAGVVGAVTSVDDFATFDADGPSGPQPAQLIVAGRFETAGGSAAANIAAWDGASWSPLGSGVDSPVRALQVFDADGDGPTPPTLFVGGGFAHAGGVPAQAIAAWDGAAWSPLASGIAGGVKALELCDLDGPGPQPVSLIAGGQFLSAGGANAWNIAAWNGSAWSRLGTASVPGLRDPVQALTVFDPDAAGPLPASLIAGGAFVSSTSDPAHMVMWTGSAWSTFAAEPDNDVIVLTVHDPDDSGPLAPVLVAGGRYLLADEMQVNHIATWDGLGWSALGEGVAGQNARLAAAALFDPDGPGPDKARPVIAGTFSSIGGIPAASIAQWDGAVWSPLGQGVTGGFNRSVNALTTFDADGAGPDLPLLIAAGSFDFAGGEPHRRIAAWNGAAWSSLSAQMSSESGSINALTTWDPDGPGPHNELLIAGGSFTTIGGIQARSIAAWDGAAWSPLGAGVSGTVMTLSAFDADGPGPGPALLIIGGDFSSAGGVSGMNRIAAWDGAAWSKLSTGFNSFVTALTTFDMDGPGGLSPILVAGGLFTVAGGRTANAIAAWDGVRWSAFGAGMNNRVDALASWDPDGLGGSNAVLVAGGRFVTAGGLSALSMASWDGSRWSPMGAGLQDGVELISEVFALLSFDPDGPSPHAPELLVAGEFTLADGHHSSCFARWAHVPAPWIARDPEPQTITANRTLVLSAMPASGFSGVSHQWLRNGEPITDGPSGAALFGGIVSGASGSFELPTARDPVTLTIQGVRVADAGEFSVRFSNACGQATTAAAQVHVLCGPADLTGDQVIDFADYLEFLNLFDALDPRADFNADGVVDSADYLEFLNLYDAGC